jgi:hypothetical protein
MTKETKQIIKDHQELFAEFGAEFIIEDDELIKITKSNK